MKATILLDACPTQTQGDVIAYTFANEQYGADVLEWETTSEVPDYLDVAIADQLSAYRRDLPADACYMTITIQEN